MSWVAFSEGTKKACEGRGMISDKEITNWIELQHCHMRIVLCHQITSMSRNTTALNSQSGAVVQLDTSTMTLHG